MTETLIVTDLGQLPYRQAWALQETAHSAVVAGEPERLLLVEHPPVVTVGRRPNHLGNLISSPEQLLQAGVELVETDRGGDITYHAPGQLVAYPIIRLIDHRLSVGAYVHKLEAIVIATLAEMGIAAQADPSAVGIWTLDGNQLAKICAIGVRVRRGVSMHGLALNVTTDLEGFRHIIPCGLNRPITSIAKLLGPQAPPMARVREILISHLAAGFTDS